MTKLTEHFTWHEATHSDTAKREGLDNTPPNAAREAIELAAFGMEAIRSLLGGKPLQVTSWYRSPAVNKAVGGSDTSSHLTGLAVDFRALHMNSRLAASAIINSPLMFDQLIWYPDQDRLHIGWGEDMRREVMTKRNKKSYEAGLTNGN